MPELENFTIRERLLLLWVSAQGLREAGEAPEQEETFA